MYRILLAIVVLALLAVPVNAQEQLITNGGFEDGIAGWTNTRPDKCYSFGTISPGYTGNNAAKWQCKATNLNKFLASNEFSLTRGKWYIVRFIAKTNNGRNLWVYVSPCADTAFSTSSGIRNYQVNVQMTYQVQEIRFKATKPGCSKLALRAPGDSVIATIDQIGLVEEAATVVAASSDVEEAPQLIDGPRLEPEPALYLPMVVR